MTVFQSLFLSYSNGAKMKTTVFTLDETSSINSAGGTANSHRNLHSVPSLPNGDGVSGDGESGGRGGGGGDGGSESMASFDTVDAVSVKNMNSNAIPKVMMSSAPPGFKISLSSQKGYYLTF